MITGTAPQNSHQILQHNRLVLSGQDITLQTKQLVYIIAKHLDREGAPDQIVTLSSAAVLAFMNASGTRRWSNIRRIVQECLLDLALNPVTEESERGDFTMINWISRLDIKGGVITARFSPEIAEMFFYRDRTRYTNLLYDLRSYKSAYTARIVDLLQVYHRKREGAAEITFDYPIDRLRLFFSAHAKYPRWSDFEARILAPAQRELAEGEDTPYHFTYDKIKTGRAITALTFRVHVRVEALQRMAPELDYVPRDAAEAQTNFFSDPELLSPEKHKILQALIALSIPEAYALNIAHQFTPSQLMGYGALVKYGVNRKLAADLIRDHASFGELRGHEHAYVRFTLDHIESSRVERAKEKSTGKRITPEGARGGLAKEVFIERQFFAAFMEALGRKRKEVGNANGRDGRGKTVSDILAASVGVHEA